MPIVSLTLWSKQLGAPELTRVAHELETELKRIPGTRDIYSLGSQSAVLRVMPDPAALSAHGISWGELSPSDWLPIGWARHRPPGRTTVDQGAGGAVPAKRAAGPRVGGGAATVKPVYLGMWPVFSLGQETPTKRSWMGQGIWQLSGSDPGHRQSSQARTRSMWPSGWRRGSRFCRTG